MLYILTTTLDDFCTSCDVLLKTMQRIVNKGKLGHYLMMLLNMRPMTMLMMMLTMMLMTMTMVDDVCSAVASERGK